MVPVRDDVDVLAVADQPIVPLPVPELPLVIPSQVALDEALQVQPPCVVTWIVPVPPAAAGDAEVGLSA